MKYLGRSQSFAYNGVAYKIGDDVPISRADAEHMNQQGQHVFEGVDQSRPVLIEEQGRDQGAVMGPTRHDEPEEDADEG